MTRREIPRFGPGCPGREVEMTEEILEYVEAVEMTALSELAEMAAEVALSMI